MRSTVFLNRWTLGITLSASLIILLATLMPFDFTLEDFTVKQAFRAFFQHPSDFNDIIANIFLFMPFGFGIAWELEERKFNRITTVAIALVLSALFSLGVETLQIFLPSRASSWVDICTNGTGGVVGALTYFSWTALAPGRSRFLANLIERKLSVKTLAIALIAWVIFSCAVCFGLQQAANLSNWDSSFPLLIGNEKTGDRPWKGTVSQLQISDRAISSDQIHATLTQQEDLPKSSLVTAYSLIGQGNYLDRTGNLPDLAWQGKMAPSSPPSLSSDHWLSTTQPVNVLSERLKLTSEFTIYTTVSTPESYQRGPARIVSLSANSGERNLTIAQDKSDLLIRLRTPITGENGTFTGLFVPGVFSDAKPHQLLITYRQSFLRVYVDRPENVYFLELIPKITLFRYLFPFEEGVFRIGRRTLLLYTTLFYGVFFIPIGLLLALISTRIKGTLKFYLLLSFLAIVIPSLFLGIIMYRSYVEIEDLAISTAIGFSTLLFAKKRLNYWLQY
jgi:glycopeptide antibiotics resistance protein